MNKNLILFVIGLTVLCFIIGFLLFESDNNIQEKLEPSTTKKQPIVIKPEKKVVEVATIEKEVKKPVEEIVSVVKDEKEQLPKKTEKIENEKVKSEVKVIVEKKNEAEVKKPLYSFVLEFKGVDETSLPEEAEINLNITQEKINTSALMNIKKLKGDKFMLHLENQNSPSFDIRIKNIGYAKNILIPYEKENIINIQLEKGARISGVISDVSGKGIPNVAITLLAEIDAGFGVSYFIPKSKGSLSDEFGNYQLSEIELGRFKIQLKHEKFITLEKWVVFPLNGEQIINYQMEEGALIEGLVVDQNEIPAKEAIIKFKKAKKDSMFDMDFSGNTVREIKSDLNGQFNIAGVEIGSYHLTAEVKDVGHIRDFKVEIQKGEKKKTIKLVLKKSLQIKGQVVDQSGKALEGVILKASNDKTNFFGGRGNQNDSTTDKEGKFIFDFLEDKSYTISIESEIYRLASKAELEIKAGTEDAVVTLKEMVELKGIVLLPNGQKAKEYVLWLRYNQFDFKAPLKNVIISDDGFSARPKVFSMGGNSTKIFLVVKAKGFEEGVSKEIEYNTEVNLIDDIKIQLKEEAFEIFKISTFDNKKISEIEYIASAVAKRLNSMGVIEKATLDENSQIKLSGLKNTEFDLFFKLNGYASVLLKYKQSENTTAPEVVFTKGSTIKGLAYEANGQSSSYQKINLKRTDILSISLMQHLNFTVQTNDKGEFSFENIPLGEYRLKKINPDKAFSPMDMFNTTEGESVKLVKDQDVIINIGTKEEPLSQISGQILLDDKIYDKGAMVYLSGNVGDSISKMNTSDQEGKFNIPQVKHGKYSLMVGMGGVASEEMERFPIIVEENKENFFAINIYSEKISGVINAIDGEKLNGNVSVFKSGFLSSQLNLLDAFTESLYTSSFKNGQFSVKFPKSDAVDVYFSFSSKKYSAIYFQKVSKDEILKKNWTLEVYPNVTKVLKVVDDTGKKISNYDLDICDDKGIALISDIKGIESNSDSLVEEVYLPPNKDCTLYISCPEYAVTKVTVLKNTVTPIVVTLKAGFELVVIAKTRDNNIAELYDDQKKKYIRPTSQSDMIMTHLGGGNANAIKDGKKVFKNLMPGKYFVKVADEKGGNSAWSEMIEITDKNMEVEIK